MLQTENFFRLNYLQMADKAIMKVKLNKFISYFNLILVFLYH